MPTKLIPALAAIFGTDEVDDFGNPIQKPTQKSTQKPTRFVTTPALSLVEQAANDSPRTLAEKRKNVDGPTWKPGAVPDPYKWDTLAKAQDVAHLAASLMPGTGSGIKPPARLRPDQVLGDAIGGIDSAIEAAKLLPSVGASPIPISGRTAIGAVKKGLDVLGTPWDATVAGAFDLAKNVQPGNLPVAALSAAGEALQAGAAGLQGEHTGFTDQMRKAGVPEDELSEGKGLLADAVLDPLNYVMPVKLLAALPLVAGTRAIRFSDDAVRAASAVSRAVEKAGARTLASGIVDDVVAAVPESGIAAKAGRAFPEDGVAYHGSSRAHDGPLDVEHSANGLYGPGEYWSENPKVADGYAGNNLPDGTNGGNVRQAKLGIRNALDMDAPVDLDEAKRIYDNVARHLDVAPEQFDIVARELSDQVDPTFGDFYRAMVDEVGGPSVKGQINRGIIDSGFDGITHMGSAGDLPPHRVWITLDNGRAVSKWGTQVGLGRVNMMADLAGGTVGAATGGALDQENPLRGAALGAVAGVAGAEGIARMAGTIGARGAAAAATPPPSVVDDLVEDKYVKGMLSRVPERREALGVPELGGTPSKTSYDPGTPRGVEDEKRIDAFIEKRVGVTNPSERAMARRIWTDAENFYRQRRMAIDPQTGQVTSRTWGTTEDAAWGVVWNRSRIAAGTALNAEQVVSLERAVRGATDYATEIAQHAQEATVRMAGTPQDQARALALMDHYGVKSVRALEIKADQAMDEAKFLWQSVAGARSEAGRSLNIMRKKIDYRMVAKGDDDFIKRAAELGADGGEIRQKLLSLTTPEQRYRYLRSMGKPNARQMFQYYYLTSLLSGPLTHARNTVSNVIGSLSMDAGFAVGRGADVLTGRVSLLDYRDEVAAMVHGQRVGVAQGWRAAMDVWRQGFTAQDARIFAEKPPEVKWSDILGVDKFDGERSTRILNSVSRFLEASDQFARTIMYSGALHAGAYREASKMLKAGKIKPSQFQKTIDEIIKDPDIVAPKVFEEASRIAKDSVYRQEPGQFLKWVMRGQQLADERAGTAVRRVTSLLPGKAQTVANVVTAPLQNPGTFLFPFIKTPAGVFKRQFRSMGGGLVTAASAAKDGREIEAAIRRGEALLGIGMMAGIGVYAGASARPVITGVGPMSEGLAENPQKALDAFYMENRPSSIRIGDHWFDYRAMGPLAGPLSILGNLSDSMRTTGGEFTYETASMMLGRQARAMLSNSFLTGVMGLVGAFEDRTGVAANRTVGRMASSLVPYSAALRATRTATDNVIRDTRGETWGESIKHNLQNITPGLSRQVPARVNYAGETLKQPGSAISRLFNPFATAEVKENPTVQAMEGLGPDAYMTKPPKKLLDELGDPMDLTTLQSTHLQRTVGQAQFKAARDLVAMPSFRDLPVSERTKLLREYMADARDLAKRAFRAHLRSLSTARPQ